MSKMIVQHLYQLVAHGRTRLTDEAHKISSKKVFCSKAEAEAHIPEFKEVCAGTDNRDKATSFWDLDPADVKVTIVELEIVPRADPAEETKQ